jgi:hypothetical protein
VNAEVNLRSELPDIFRQVAIKLFETYRKTRNEQEPSAEPPNATQAMENSSSVIETDNSFNTSALSSSQATDPLQVPPANFDEAYLSSLSGIFSPLGSGVDALLAVDWNFGDFGGLDEEQPIEES